jgi:hypothetical protein
MIKVCALYPTMLIHDENIVIITDCAGHDVFLKRQEEIIIDQQICCSVLATAALGHRHTRPPQRMRW